MKLNTSDGKRRSELMVELEPRTLVGGLVVGESPRWHDGRLWFANWGAAQEIRTVDLEGHSEVVAKGPKPAGYCIDWLPNGDLLVTGERPDPASHRRRVVRDPHRSQRVGPGLERNRR